MHRRSILTAATRAAALVAGLAMTLGLPGCAGLGGPRVVTLGEAELNTLVARQFPRQQRLLEVFDVEISRPALRLLPERNRLAVTLALSARDRLSLSHDSNNIKPVVDHSECFGEHKKQNNSAPNASSASYAGNIPSVERQARGKRTGSGR